jgi:hypothetical protein
MYISLRDHLWFAREADRSFFLPTRESRGCCVLRCAGRIDGAMMRRTSHRLQEPSQSWDKGWGDDGLGYHRFAPSRVPIIAGDMALQLLASKPGVDEFESLGSRPGSDDAREGPEHIAKSRFMADSSPTAKRRESDLSARVRQHNVFCFRPMTMPKCLCSAHDMRKNCNTLHIPDQDDRGRLCSE